MAELTPKERLQPSLLDRLTDHEPEKAQESRQQRVFTQQQWLQMIKRDLGWLFNTGYLEHVVDLAPFDDVRTATVNYGVPELSGAVVANLSATQIETIFKEAILRFEPRILPKTLTVTAHIHEDVMDNNAIGLSVDGHIWNMPTPLRLYVHTEIDLDTGHVVLTDSRGRVAGD